jgi:tripartite-type tricarboxylate transporter receptor subunit TctC
VTIAPVAGFDRSFFVMVTNPAFPAKTVSEFIAYAKANPGKVDMASNGTGTVTHLAGALFMAMSGVELVHVPYSGNFFTDLISGKVNVAFSPVAPVIGGIRDGTLRALAVTSARRSQMFPDVPAMAEVIPGYEAILWDGFGAPRNTPAEIVDKLDKEISAALADPKVKDRLADFGAGPMPMAASEFRNLVDDQTKKWAKVIATAGIKVE